jgi:hypothetical protein
MERSISIWMTRIGEIVKDMSFLRTVRRLLVTAKVVPSSSTVILMMEGLRKIRQTA